ncbi:MAG: HlyD family efflux transporter periplasmic adaptor subunit [Planctomycetes bacterium]|nr:HlyD family efflux transporter periplasmic adaptor subunit [Planctomycetota bacterium]
MNRKLVLPVLALAGAGFASWSVAVAHRAVVVPPCVEPPRPAFALRVTGSGIVEARSRNVAIGSPSGRIALEVPVRAGDLVEAGDVLFRLDDRDLLAELMTARASVAAAQQRLARLASLPRAEETPVLEARLAAAAAKEADARERLAVAQSVRDPRAISGEEVSRRGFAAVEAGARRAEADADLALHRAGAWHEDVAVAEAELAEAEARAQSLEVEVDRMVVRAPIDGTVLQLNLRAGEFAAAGDVAHVVLGDLTRLHLRVDIDENDAWRFQAGADAVATLRGNAELRVPLAFEYVEPLVVPKQELSGQAVERVDTRVLQVVFSFEPDTLPIHVGQQMDVDIDATRGVAP